MTPALRTDPRAVFTLDAGGTTFAFSAIRGGEVVAESPVQAARGDDLGACLAQIAEGFEGLRAVAGPPAALSFAFPGPADYPAGVILRLWNMPAFREPVPLGPILEGRFGVPVYLNNDGDLFTLGEALGGLLPRVNAWLEAAGNPRRYRTLLGLTLGTGLGAGLTRDGRMLLGDNAAGLEIWSLRHPLAPGIYAEEGTSIRAVRRVYGELAGLDAAAVPEPKGIWEVAEGRRPGESTAAREAFRRVGQVAGEVAAAAIGFGDGLLVLGGGLTGAANLILPALLAELNGTLRRFDGTEVQRLESKAFDLEDPVQRAAFLEDATRSIGVPGTGRQVSFQAEKRVGVGLSVLGTARATALGAWAFALESLDRQA